MSDIRLIVDDDAAFRAADLKLERILRDLQEMRTAMSVELDTLKANVAELRTVADSAVTLLNGLSAQIASLKNDPVALQQLADDI